MKNYCVECKKEISSGAKMCKSCANKGKNNPAWIGGKDKEKYVGFTRELRGRIHYRDKFTCQICGKKMTTFGTKTDKLEVHHIDYNKENCDLDNLISLCHNDHMRTNKPKDREKWQSIFASQ